MTDTSILHRTEASDGVRIAFQADMAGPELPALVLVHSLGMDHAFWQPVIDRLKGRATWVAIDARGHGESGKPAGPYTVARMAQDVLDVARHLGLDRVHVAGASMGGCVALQFAASYPAATAGLALIDTTAWYGPTAPQDWAARANKAVREGMAALVEFQKTRWFSDAFREQHPDVLERCVQVFLANDSAAFAASCRMLGAFDARAQLDAVRVPACVLVGEEDYAAPPEMARALHHGIAGSRFTLIPRARHLTPLEEPGIVADHLLSLLHADGRA